MSGFHGLRHGQDAPLRIQADDVAHEILPGFDLRLPRVRREPHEHERQRAAQVLLEGFPDQIHEHLEGRAVVDLEDEILVGLGDDHGLAHGLTALGELDGGGTAP